MMILNILLNICVGLRIATACSEFYFNPPTTTGTSKHGFEIFPQTFQYLQGDTTKTKSQFVLSYSYARRSPIWAFEHFKAVQQQDSKKNPTDVPQQDSKKNPTDVSQQSSAKGGIKSDGRITNSNFIPTYRGSPGSPYEFIPLVHPDNHENSANVAMHTNYVLVRASSDELQKWNDINQEIRNLMNNGAKDMRVCTGTLFRTENQKLIHDEIREQNGFYNSIKDTEEKKADQKKPKNKGGKNTDDDGNKGDTMTYEIKMGFAIPDALYKVFTYKLGDNNDKKQYLAMYVVPFSGRDDPAPLVNNFWSSLHGLERLSGVYLFEEELHRLNEKSRTFINTRCSGLTAAKLATMKVPGQNFFGYACDITGIELQDKDITASNGNERMGESKPVKQMDFEKLRNDQNQIKAEHAFETFYDHVVNYNYKNLVPDWVIDHLNDERHAKFRDGKTKRLPFKITPAMSKPFLPRDHYFVKSKYEKGHMSAAQYHKDDAKHESLTFTMNNIAPQDAELNKKTWKYLETEILKYFKAEKFKEMYVITGPIYCRTEGRCKYKLMSKHRLAVPNALFKVVMFVGGKDKNGKTRQEVEIKSYKFKNKDNTSKYAKLPDYPQTTLSEITADVGFEIFEPLSGTGKRKTDDGSGPSSKKQKDDGCPQ